MTRFSRTAVALLAAVAGLMMLYQSLARFVTYHHRTYDLALYARQAWGLARLDLWNPILDQHFLASHWSFVLLPIGIAGRAYGTANALLIAQALAFAVTAWPLARFGARRGGGPLALLAALAFFLYPNTFHVATYEFHPGNLALPGLAFSLDAIDRRDRRGLVLSSLWVLMCRADFALATLMLAIVAWLRGRPLRPTALRLGLGSVAYFALVMAVRAALVTDVGPSSADLHFGRWGGSPLGFLLAPWNAPRAWLAHVTDLDRAGYPLRVLAPLALLPVLRPRYALVALPFIAINLVSHFPTSIRMYSHYLTPAVPALVAAAIDALAHLPRARPLAGGLLVAGLALGSVVAGGAPWSRDYVRFDYAYDHQSFWLDWVHREIPDGVSVQAPDALLPHLAERARVHRAPPPERGTEIVILDARHRVRFLGRESLLRTVEEPLVRTWLARTDYAVIAATPIALVLARASSPRAVFSQRFFRAPPTHTPPVSLTDCLGAYAAHLQGDTLSLHLDARGPCPADLALRIGSRKRPDHVRLLFDGYFSPAHLRAGDAIVSVHPLPATLAKTIAERGLRLGALRSRGAPPRPDDPVSVPVPVLR